MYGSVPVGVRKHPELIAYRHRWLEALFTTQQIEAVVTLGTLAAEAWQLWQATPQGQADFAQITIEYVPNLRCVESKSLKFYLASYRNERAFNEVVTNRILDDFVLPALDLGRMPLA